jgi:Cft2 family RNA processing exonuclease
MQKTKLKFSPGMMQSGLSRELFESWCTDKKSGVIIAGYCVEGTLAKANKNFYRILINIFYIKILLEILAFD